MKQGMRLAVQLNPTESVERLTMDRPDNRFGSWLRRGTAQHKAKFR